MMYMHVIDNKEEVVTNNVIGYIRGAREPGKFKCYFFL